MMTKLFLILLFAAFMIAVPGCKDTEDTEPQLREVEITEENLYDELDRIEREIEEDIASE